MIIKDEDVAFLKTFRCENFNDGSTCYDHQLGAVCNSCWVRNLAENIENENKKLRFKK